MFIKKIVDLSYSMESSMPYYSDDPSFSLTTFSFIEDNGYKVSKISLGSHSGTHVDAPLHMDNAGISVDKLDLALFFGEAYFVDVSHKKENEAISFGDFHLEKNFSPNTIVVFYTNWDKWAEQEKFFNHPYLEKEVLDYYLDLGIKTFAIDTLNFDSPIDHELKGHHLLAQKGGVMVENLKGVDKIIMDKEKGKWFLALFPLKIVNGDASPCRAVGILIDR